MKKKISSLFILSLFIIVSCTNHGTESTKETGHATDSLSSIPPKQVDANKMLKPCKWSFVVEQKNAGEATLIATAAIEDGWHLYSQKVLSQGPLPTEFHFDSLASYQLMSSPEEQNVHHQYDSTFAMEVFYFEKEAVFKQKIKVTGKIDFTISGTVNYEACLTQCVNDQADFSFPVKGNPKGISK